MQDLNLACCQMNSLVGDIEGNAKKIADMYSDAVQKNADIVVFPELALIGYPPEDLLLRPSLQGRIEGAIEALKTASGAALLVVGHPWQEQESLFNAVSVFADGAVVARYFKRKLPNYRVFDEKRYFKAGEQSQHFEYKGALISLSICEDIWHEEMALEAGQQQVDLILSLNASPFHTEKLTQRYEMLQQRAKQSGSAIAYVNMCGAQDELIFDGASMLFDSEGQLIFQAPSFEDGVYITSIQAAAIELSGAEDKLKNIYDALVVGVRDYVNKNGFKGAVLGLSGGIDSALTLAVAVDALGAEHVEAVMMPFRYTSQMSLDDAAEQAKTLDVSYQVLPIEPIFNAFDQTLAPLFEGLPQDKTEENLQSRSRGVLLMAISNKTGKIVLTTGNKSEMAVGYATLYGDMAGGFDVLKDVAKITVFDLCRYRNSLQDHNIIPQRVIDRPPSAELAPGQEDTDSLPPYEELDDMLYRYVECDESAEQIVAAGYDRDTVYRVLRMIDINEYKRRQSAVGPRITRRGFGKDRRYPITNGWKLGD